MDIKHKFTALIVDDSDGVLMVLTYILAEIGIEVVTAGDGKTALDLAQQRRFDLVITDINMPYMGGIELIHALRQLPSYRNTPILSLSNLNAERVVTKARQAGASGWVQKPVGRSGLLKALEQVAGYRTI